MLALHKLSPQAHGASEQHGAATKVAHLIPWPSMPAVFYTARRAQDEEPKILGISRGYRVSLQLVAQTQVIQLLSFSKEIDIDSALM